MRDNKEAKGETTADKTSLEDDSTKRVRRESQEHQGYQRLETAAAQGTLLVLLGGLLMALVVMAALVFGLRAHVRGIPECERAY